MLENLGKSAKQLLWSAPTAASSHLTGRLMPLPPLLRREGRFHSLVSLLTNFGKTRLGLFSDLDDLGPRLFHDLIHPRLLIRREIEAVDDLLIPVPGAHCAALILNNIQ